VLSVKKNILRNNRGIALLETIPLVVIFVMLMSFGMGLFGLIHTAILHSIAARTYSMETFRQRANLSYFREDGSGLDAAKSFNYTKKQWRYQAVQHEADARNVFVATVRPIALGRTIAGGDATETTNNVSIFAMQSRNEKIGINPGWVMVGYGICLRAECGN
jgi:hypothetical protein